MESRCGNVVVQGIGGGVQYVNDLRFDKLLENLRMQDINLENALNELSKAEAFIADSGHILGSDLTKHGEIAEVFEVRFGNADQLINGKEAIYDIDSVGRLAPEDFLKNNFPVQSKFVQSNLSMDAVLDHLKKYPDFVNDGGSYCIPKDYHEQIEKWLKLSQKELDNLPSSDGGNLARRVVERVRELEKQTGKSFDQLVEASQLEYNQVQLNRAGDVLEQKEQEIIDVDEKKRDDYWEMAKPSLGEAFKVAGISAAISGVISFCINLVATAKSQNKKIKDITKEEWVEILKRSGIDAAKGGASAGAIYILTNFADVTAPFAAALVSATLGVVSEAVRLCKNEISFDDFMHNILERATEAAVSGIGAVVGQIAIPVPVLGATVGAMVTTTILRLVKKYILSGGYCELAKKAYYENAFSQMYIPVTAAYDRAYKNWNIRQEEIKNIRSRIMKLDDDINVKITQLDTYIEGI